MVLTIAMDGPVGAGKSSVADEVARRLGILHLDTGAMYRAFAWQALKEGIDTNNAQALAALAERTMPEVRFENGASLSFKVGWAANLREENNIVLAGKKKGVDIEGRRIYSGSDDVNELAVLPNGFQDEPFYGHFCIVDNLYECLTGNAEPFVKPEETINTTAIIEAAYRSAEAGEEIKLL